MLTPERIKELSDRHLRVVGAGYVRPQDAEEFARAIESEVRRLHAENADRAARAPADSVLEDAGGANWQDISTAPKDGSRFVATGHNYGLYSEGRHACVAQWFRGSWIEASDWNETSELTYLTHWMPLPPPPTSAEGVEHG